ncbi:mucin-4-like [Plakobranchus ocellatus]|uniref:Mucin-4-like n=1 Tax=Plakobranchus ocellatus TaxID=259542 RepID=A0AAV4BUN8_9GAST|nr:mucin-4-like [Plakobranchus ocellatus]
MPSKSEVMANILSFADEDEADSSSVEYILKSEQFLSAEKTWRAHARGMPVPSWLDLNDVMLEEDSNPPAKSSDKNVKSEYTNSKSSYSSSSDSISKKFQNKINRDASENGRGSSDSVSLYKKNTSLSSTFLYVPTLASPSSPKLPTLSSSSSSLSSVSLSSSSISSEAKVSSEEPEVFDTQQSQENKQTGDSRPAASSEISASDGIERTADSKIWEDFEVLGIPDKEEEEESEDGWLVEEVFLARDKREVIPNFDEWDWSYGPSLSRHRRDLVPGSGETVVKLRKVLAGVLTSEQATDGTTENVQLKSDIAVALDTYLSSFIASSDFEVEVTSLNTPNITVEADILFTEADVTLTQIATALVNLDNLGNFKVGSNIYDVDFPYLEPSPNAELRFFPHGPAQGDSTLTKDEEFASAKITIESTIPYGSELLSDIYISVNGLISFEEEFSSFSPQPLPFENRKLLAVYWSDLDLAPTDTAEVYYQLYTKSTSNSALEVAVFSLANAAVVQYTEQTAYDATSVLVVTWDGVPPWPALSSLDERVTFQAAIISDGSTTYVVYIYGQGGMNFNPVIDRPVEVGWLDNNLDTAANYYVFDTVIGNTGNLGMWIVELGSVVNYRALCIQFFRDSVPLIPAISFWNAILPQCPCSKQTAQNSFFWLPALNGDPNCFDMFPIFGQLGRRCCYRADGSNAFENRIPDVGSFQLFTPYYGDLVNHEIYDTDPKEWCCTLSNLCTLYYLVRPVRTCRNRNTRRAFCFGDPHIETLDNRQFIFNGLGEYTLMDIDGVTPDNIQTNFKLQGRTCLALAADGNVTDATVWCALAMQNTNGSSLRVTVHESGTCT